MKVPVSPFTRPFPFAGLLLVIGLFGFVSDAPTRAEKSAHVRGLDGVAIDLWNSNLLRGKPARGFPDDASETIVALFERELGEHQPTENLPVFFTALREHFAKNYEAPEDYLRLAEALYRARDQIRLREPSLRVRGAAFLLSLLNEETLYVGQNKFSTFPREWLYRGPAADEKCRPKSAPSNFYGLPLCAGDTIVSKGDEFSSALILFRSPRNAAFSHVGFAVPDSQSRRLHLLEADAYGGRVNDYSEEDAPLRASIYRQRRALDSDGKNVIRALAQAKKVISRATERQIFDFNLHLKPECKPGSYFCTELIYCLFKDSGVDEASNPYSSKYWTPLTEPISDFASQIWNVHWGDAPAPGDIEWNPAYELVGHRVDLSELSRTRIQFITLNSLLRLVIEDAALAERYREAIEWLGKETLGGASPETVHRLAKLKILRTRELVAIRAKLPGELPLKEVIFYYHIQHQVLPEVEELVDEAIARSPGTAWSLGKIERIAEPALRDRIAEFTRLVGMLQALK